MCLAVIQSTQLGPTNAIVPMAYDDLKTALEQGRPVRVKHDA